MFYVLFFVYFGLHAPVFSTRNNFRDYFDAVANNDTKGSLKFKEAILKSEEKDAQTFNKMKADMMLSRYNKRNRIIYELNHPSEHKVTKREEDNSIREIILEKFSKNLDDELESKTCEEKVVCLRKKLIAAEENIISLMSDIAKKNLQKDMLCRPLMVVKLKLVLETEINDLYPGVRPEDVNYIEAITNILSSKIIRFTERMYIKQFRKMVTDSTLGIDRFIEAIKQLYPKLSDVASHMMEGYARGAELPEHTDINKITNILKCVMKPVPDDCVVAVQLILTPRKVPPKYPINIPLEEYCCIRITAETNREQKKLDAYKDTIKIEDVHRIFPTTQTTRVQFQMDEATKTIELIKAHFPTERIARRASFYRHGWLKDVRITVDQIPCNGEPVPPLVTG